jgi:hypothetical protein
MKGQFDREHLDVHPLAERRNKLEVERDTLVPGSIAVSLSPEARSDVAAAAAEIVAARSRGASVMLAFGAHSIKNGLSLVLKGLMEGGWVTHFATNGAGVIHDWEFAFGGQSSEHVGPNVARGEFGNWEETGRFINLAIAVGAHAGMGYGEAVGAMIEQEGVTIPTADALVEEIRRCAAEKPGQAAAAGDLLEVLRIAGLAGGRLDIPHPQKRYSVQAAAFRRGIPFTGHPMIGHDIIYNHPVNHGGAIGRAALRDFLTYANSVRSLEDGVYMSIGSAVMSPMIFEKSLSMSQNVALQTGPAIQRHYILVVDLAESTWDWSRGEPPETDPAYYLRYNKSFSRMGGTMRYLQMDNRDFLLHLAHGLGLGSR